MIEIDKNRSFKPIDIAIIKTLKRNSKMMKKALKQNVKIMKKIFNKMIFFERFNLRSIYEQDEQNNFIDQKTYHNNDYNNDND